MVLDPKMSYEDIYTDLRERSLKGEGSFEKYIAPKEGDTEEQASNKRKLGIKVLQFLRDAKKKASINDPSAIAEAFKMFKIVDDALDNVETEPFQAIDEYKTNIQKKGEQLIQKRKKEEDREQKKEQKEKEKQAVKKPLEKIISSLKDRLEKAKTNLDSAMENLTDEEKEKIDEIERRLDTIKEKEVELKEKRDKHLPEYQELSEKRKELLSAYYRASKEGRDFEQVKEIDKKIEDIKEKIGRLNTELHDQGQLKEELLEELNSINKDINRHFNIVDELEGMLYAAEAEKDLGLETYTSLSRETYTGGDVDHSLSVMRQKIEDKKKHVENLELEDIGTEEGEIEEFNATKEESIKELDEMLSTLDSPTEDKKELEKELTPRLKEVFKNIQENLTIRHIRNKKKSGIIEAMSILQKHISSTQEKIDSLDIKGPDDYHRKIQLQKELDNYKRQLSIKQEQLNKVEGASDKMVTLSTKEQDRISELMSKGVSADEALSMVKKDQRITDQTDEQLQVILDALASNLKELNKEIIETDDIEEKEELTKERDNIQSQINSLQQKLGVSPELHLGDTPVKDLDDLSPEEYDKAISQMYDLGDELDDHEFEDMDAAGGKTYDLDTWQSSIDEPRRGIAEGLNRTQKLILESFIMEDEDELPSDFFIGDDVEDVVIDDEDIPPKPTEKNIYFLPYKPKDGVREYLIPTRVTSKPGERAETMLKSGIKAISRGIQIRAKNILESESNKRYISQKIREYLDALRRRGGPILSILNDPAKLRNANEIEQFIGFLKEFLYSLYIETWDKERNPEAMKMIERFMTKDTEELIRSIIEPIVVNIMNRGQIEVEPLLNEMAQQIKTHKERIERKRQKV